MSNASEQNNGQFVYILSGDAYKEFVERSGTKNLAPIFNAFVKAICSGCISIEPNVGAVNINLD